MAIAKSPEEALRSVKKKIKPVEQVKKIVENVSKGVEKVTSRVFKEDPRDVAVRRRAMAQQQRVAKAVSYEEQQYLRRMQASQQAARDQARRMQEYLASLNEKEAMEFLEQNNVQTTEVGEDGTIYPNKWNRRLAYKQMYFNAVEAKKRFHEKPKDWEQRRYQLEQIQMQRQREDWKRNNLLRAHESGVKMPKNWLVVEDTRIEAPNVFSRNNPNNKNVFDERGRPNILSTPNAFSADRFDVQAMNPLKAQNLFTRGNPNNNIFSRRSPYHNSIEDRKQPNILAAPNVFGNNNHLNFGKVDTEDDYDEYNEYSKPKRSKKKPKAIKFNLWKA